MTSSKKLFDKLDNYQESDKLLTQDDDLENQHRQLSSSQTGPGADSYSRTRTRTLLVTLCILVTEMCERLTYYSIVANLVLFCTSQLDIEQTDATNINQIFSGFVYLISIFGGFISDSYLGRFRTIFASSLIYIIGVVLLPASAFDYYSWGWPDISASARTAIFISSLVFVAFGTGGIKANVGPFGAEQVDSLGKGAVQSFFNWFYWVVNVGALVAYGGVSYVQQNVSFAWGFFIPLVSMVLAVSIFIAVRLQYVRTQPKGSVLTTAWSICLQGTCRPPRDSQAQTEEDAMLGRAKKSRGGSYDDHIVDGLVSVIKVTPFCLLVVMYWAIYSQMSNTFFAQSERMDVRLGDGINIPAAALNVFNTISVILLIPLVDRFLYPFCRDKGRPLTYLKRMGIGMVLSVLSMLVAGVVEIYRKEDLVNYHIQELAGQKFNASSMSVFVQIPQFALIGAGEIFTSVTTLEFAYNQAPTNMQGLLTGLFLAASGVGSWVSTAILSIVQAATEEAPWWCDEINECNMEYLLFLLGGLMFINFLIFCVVAHFYSYQDPEKFQILNSASPHKQAPSPGRQGDLFALNHPPGNEYGSIEVTKSNNSVQTTVTKNL